MESVNLEMGELFDNGLEQDDFVQAPLMPDLEDDDAPMRRGERDENEEGDVDESVLAKLKDIKGGAKKRVLRPQPKLDSDRLQTDRGLPILPNLMKEVKFKGKGHEAHDLKLMMGKLEHWAHRLYPKITFDGFIERLEKLGQKKAVQTCIKRIRLDIPVLTNDYVENKSDEEPENTSAITDEVPKEDDMDAEEAFDEMIRQEREQVGLAKKSQPDHVESTTLQSQLTSLQSSQSLTPSQSPKGSSLTDGQKERMERNKRLAMDKRLARLGKTPTGKGQQLSASQSDVDNSACKESTQTQGSKGHLQETVNDAQKEMDSTDELLNLLTEEEKNEMPTISKILSQDVTYEKIVSKEAAPETESEGPTCTKENHDTDQLHLVMTETENEDMNMKPEIEETENDQMKLELIMTEEDMETDNQTKNHYDTETGLKLELSDQSEEETGTNGQSTSNVTDSKQDPVKLHLTETQSL